MRGNARFEVDQSAVAFVVRAVERDVRGAAGFRHIQDVVGDHLLLLAFLVGPRCLRSVATGACKRHRIHIVLLCAQQQFRRGATPRTLGRMVHEVDQCTRVHVAKSLEHHLGRPIRPAPALG